MYHASAPPEPAQHYVLTYGVPDHYDEAGNPVEGYCIIRIWRDGDTIVAVCTDDPTCPILMNFYSELIANLVWESEGRPRQFIYVEQWVDQRVLPTLVSFAQQDDRLVDVKQRRTVDPTSFIGQVLDADYLTL